MKIILVGAGKVGEVLCRDLSNEGNDVILIEQNTTLLNRLIEKYDITGIAGSGTSYDDLLEAGIDTADVFIAITQADEINIISSIMAKKLGAFFTIARVRNPEYRANIQFVQEELGISLMINPEYEAATLISNTLKFPDAIQVETFHNNRVSLVEIGVDEDDFIVDMALKDIPYGKDKVLICIVHRGDNVFIPSGNSIINKGDKIHVTGSYSAVKEFCNRMNSYKLNNKNALIIGGGDITYYLTKILLQRKANVKIIERDHKRAEYLSDSFPKALVVNGDGTEQEFLKEEGIASYDAVIALTGMDEENIILSMFAMSQGVHKTITKVNRTALIPLIERTGLDTIITPKEIIADVIIRVIRSRINYRGSKIEALHRLVDNRVEVLVFSISSDCKAIGITLNDLQILDNTIIACILRCDELIFPGGGDSIKYRDQVMLVTMHKNLDDFDDFLKG